MYLTELIQFVINVYERNTICIVFLDDWIVRLLLPNRGGARGIPMRGLNHD